MIILYSNNDTPVDGSGVKCQEGAPVVNTSTPVQELVNFCFCEYGCEYTEKAFVDLNDLTDRSKNDKADLLAQVNDPSGEVKFYLITTILQGMLTAELLSQDINWLCLLIDQNADEGELDSYDNFTINEALSYIR